MYLVNRSFICYPFDAYRLFEVEPRDPLRQAAKETGRTIRGLPVRFAVGSDRVGHQGDGIQAGR